MPSGQPRFFCESCDAEVPRDAVSCPSCGRYFASVRCPKCGFIGEEALFRGGCPICGYSTGKPSREKNDGSKGTLSEKKPSGALPVWVYILTALVFLGVIIALYIRFSG